ncbi:glutathione S-transferase N-terminal domain-containing protein [Emcibacter sp. SYSU 3D8]|uniref:glutathione S-transferase N-terminal domain-containing protein n=1 Tax=Emcibacter sp. SYSU 3D8 TaxID=3133969 RepID=UPI0031FEA19F
MKIHASPASPYVRKVRALAVELGVPLEIVMADAGAANSTYGQINPIHRVPTLELDNGDMLFDSPVICEYLDAAHGGGFFPPAGAERWRVLKLQALGDGIMDAAVPRRGEVLRPEQQQSPARIAAYERSIRQVLDALENDVAGLDGVNIGTIAVACALGYLDFRFPDDAWHTTRPALKAWYDAFAQRLSMVQTEPY